MNRRPPIPEHTSLRAAPSATLQKPTPIHLLWGRDQSARAPVVACQEGERTGLPFEAHRRDPIARLGMCVEPTRKRRLADRRNSDCTALFGGEACEHGKTPCE